MMPSASILVFGDGIERRFPLHGFCPFVSFVSHVGKTICICILLGPGPKLVFCLFIFCNYLFIASSLL